MIRKITAAILLVFAFGVSAQAQSKAELALKIERLEREMIALENRLRGSNGVSAPAQSGGSVSDRVLLADLAAKIGTVERQMRSLTGRLEEMEFRLRQQDQAMEMLRKELTLQQQEASEYRAAQAANGAGASGPQQNTASGSAVSAEPDTPAPAVQEAAKPDVALPEGDAAAQYQYAFDFIQKNELDDGFTAMELFLNAHPEDSRAGNAKFWLGRIHLLRGRMPQAAQQLLALIEEHPNHKKRVDALIDLADVLIALDSASDACNALAEFRRSDDKASQRLKTRADRTAQEAGCQF